MVVPQSVDTGISIGNKAGPIPIGVAKSNGSSLRADARDKDGAVEVTISGNETFPLAPSPGITFDFKLTIPTDASRVDISGSHDGFPAFEIFAVTEDGELNIIFSFDPRATGQTLLSLFPPMEFTASESVELEENP